MVNVNDMLSVKQAIKLNEMVTMKAIQIKNTT